MKASVRALLEAQREQLAQLLNGASDLSDLDIGAIVRTMAGILSILADEAVEESLAAEAPETYDTNAWARNIQEEIDRDNDTPDTGTP